MRTLFILVILCVIHSIEAQTLDNSLGVEERKVKKFGWHFDTSESSQYFFLRGEKYTGFFNFYYDNKRLKCSANFKDGNYHGLVIEYFNDGSLKSKGRYINGFKIGKWILNFDDGSYEHKTYSRKRPDEVRKSLFISSNSKKKERFKTLRNMDFTKFHYTYFNNQNLKLEKTLVNRFKKIYQIKQYHENSRLAKHYFLKFDKENKKWIYTRDYIEYNKNGKLLLHEYY